MSCIIHFLPAKSGDCFVIEFDNKDCILIDCGYVSTYTDELKPLLLKLRAKGCRFARLLHSQLRELAVKNISIFCTECLKTFALVNRDGPIFACRE